jgi:hypothetical protein
VGLAWRRSTGRGGAAPATSIAGALAGAQGLGKLGGDPGRSQGGLGQRRPPAARSAVWAGSPWPGALGLGRASTQSSIDPAASGPCRARSSTQRCHDHCAEPRNRPTVLMAPRAGSVAACGLSGCPGATIRTGCTSWRAGARGPDHRTGCRPPQDAGGVRVPRPSPRSVDRSRGLVAAGIAGYSQRRSDSSQPISVKPQKLLPSQPQVLSPSRQLAAYVQVSTGHR